MLRAPLSGRRAVWPIWSGREASLRARNHGAHRAQRFSSRPGGNGRNGRSTSEGINKDPSTNNRTSTNDGTKATHNKKPSLMEQLFPEEHKRDEEAQTKKEREVPRLPLETPIRRRSFRARPSADDEAAEKGTPPNAFRSMKAMEMQAKADSQTSVLVLLNASKNLTREDFTRLIPTGKHVEGWRLDEGDILNVIPGRNLATLEQENFYYLLFSSPLSAFAYQGHATRVSRLAAQHTPSSLHNALGPASGYFVKGMDVNEAIQSYTLTSSGQALNLRQLRPPLSPLLRAIVSKGGYPMITRRADKMPYEVRLTLEGPQHPLSRIRSVIHNSGRERALEWSGGDEKNVKITKYEPRLERSAEQLAGEKSHLGRTEDAQLFWDMTKSQAQPVDFGDSETALKRRTPIPVYIIGFHTEHAAQSFVRYWHRRPMDMGSKSADEDGELPPIANVELLW